MSSPRDLRDFMLEHSNFLKFNILMKLYLMQLIQGPSGLFFMLEQEVPWIFSSHRLRLSAMEKLLESLRDDDQAARRLAHVPADAVETP